MTGVIKHLNLLSNELTLALALKLIVAQLVKKIFAFYISQVSLLFSQKPDTQPYP
jgi:hypothetical protein